MKKLLTLLSVFTILSFTQIKDSTNNKTYTLTEGQAIMIYQHEQLLKQLLPQSELKAKDATAMFPQIDSIQKIILTQYQKNNPDTTKKK